MVYNYVKKSRQLRRSNNAYSLNYRELSLAVPPWG